MIQRTDVSTTTERKDHACRIAEPVTPENCSVPVLLNADTAMRMMAKKTIKQTTETAMLIILDTLAIFYPL